jgi:hypothetical protein
VAITSAGYDETVTQEDWADMASFFGSDTGVAGASDLQVLGASGTRVVSVGTGQAWGWGVLDTFTGSNTVTLAANTSGVTRWDAIVVRRNWSTVTTTLNAVTGTSSATVPALTVNPGVLADQVIALVAVPNGATSLVGAVTMNYKQWPAQITAGLYPPYAPSYMQRWVDLNAGGAVKQWDGVSWSDPSAPPAWVPVTLAAGFTSTGIPVAYRLHEGMVDIRGIINKSTPFAAGLSATLFTLPAGARPLVQYRQNVNIYSLSAGTHAWVQVETNGAVNAFMGAAGQSALYVSGLRFSVA